MSDLISRQTVIDTLKDMYQAAEKWGQGTKDDVIKARAESCMASIVEIKLRIEKLPSAQSEQEDYTEMKREFIRMAEYIDVLLKVSDEQKETLIGFISRLAEFMPWTERD